LVGRRESGEEGSATEKGAGMARAGEGRVGKESGGSSSKGNGDLRRHAGGRKHLAGEDTGGKKKD